MKKTSWDGTISSAEFKVGCLSLIQKWQKSDSFHPLWSWVSLKKQPCSSFSPQEEGYLCMENACIVMSTKDDDCCENQCFDVDEPVDDAVLDVAHVQDSYHYDFHVIYSDSYRVPVLYFRAYCSDGQPVMLDNFEKTLPVCSSKVLLESKWTFITLEEHPVLNRPWYKLHPCGTSEWMKLLFLDNVSQAKTEVSTDRYLVSWLSVVGQVVGVRIPFEMFKDTN